MYEKAETGRRSDGCHATAMVIYNIMVPQVEFEGLSFMSLSTCVPKDHRRNHRRVGSK